MSYHSVDKHGIWSEIGEGDLPDSLRVDWGDEPPGWDVIVVGDMWKLYSNSDDSRYLLEWGVDGEVVALIDNPGVAIDLVSKCAMVSLGELARAPDDLARLVSGVEEFLPGYREQRAWEREAAKKDV
jgi:hypothetical protein